MSWMKRIKLTLFHKFALVILIVGLFPVLLLSFFIFNNMIKSYEESVKTNYKQAALHIGAYIETMFDDYNSISKIAYRYSGGGNVANPNTEYLYYDNLRKAIDGDSYTGTDFEQERAQNINSFLVNLQSSDGYIYSAHLLAYDKTGTKLDFHYSARNQNMIDEQEFEREVKFGEYDKNSKNLQIIPTHLNNYYKGYNEYVITFARNYFDNRGVVGQSKYVGTIFLDVDIERLKVLLKPANLPNKVKYYIVNENNDCIYTNQNKLIGSNLNSSNIDFSNSRSQLSVMADVKDYGLKVIITVDTKTAFEKILVLQRMLIFALGFCILLLSVGSISFSKRLTKPIHKMVVQMAKVENGNFDVQLPIQSYDEIGILSARFNQMLITLKQYINQYYVAQIKQNEAELAALRSQIYPHFLYNTLEIIRMTALENEDLKVSKMIEALSLQIRYVIGDVKDMVPLEKEIEIAEKYIYLLNCRIRGNIQLTVNAGEASRIMVPKLILQPIIENAYIHGIKPKGGNGHILLEARQMDEVLELCIMDNGIGMSTENMEQIKALLNSNEKGIKNEYNWQSIGMKNVHDRIKYLAGEEYGIEIASTPGVGTSVLIRMPYWKGEENND